MFKLKQNKTTVMTEILAGFTTFMTMAYIVALNPNLLTNFGADGGQPLWNAVFMATCIASGIGCVLMGFLANKPFAMAPGMGLNSFFAVVVAQVAALAGVSYLQGFRAALIIILIEGVVFLALSLLRHLLGNQRLYLSLLCHAGLLRFADGGNCERSARQPVGNHGADGVHDSDRFFGDHHSCAL